MTAARAPRANQAARTDSLFGIDDAIVDTLAALEIIRSGRVDQGARAVEDAMDRAANHLRALARELGVCR